MPRGFLGRVLTGVIFLPVLFLLIHCGGWAYRGLLGLIVLLGAWEWWCLSGERRGEELALLLGGAGGTFLAVTLSGGSPLLPFLTGYLLLVLLLGLRQQDGGSRRRVGLLFLGILYVGLLPAFLARMRDLPTGREAVLLTYVTVFLCDTAAYAAGRAWGRHPLWTRVSPRKTVEGALGGVLAAMLTAWLGGRLMGGFLPAREALGFGLIVGLFGQLGDLVESLWKREAGIKDSSGLLPGHGGVLDRFDNLHFVAPLLYTYLTQLT